MVPGGTPTAMVVLSDTNVDRKYLVLVELRACVLDRFYSNRSPLEPQTTIERAI